MSKLGGVLTLIGFVVAGVAAYQQIERSESPQTNGFTAEDQSRITDLASILQERGLSAADGFDALTSQFSELLTEAELNEFEIIGFYRSDLDAFVLSGPRILYVRTHASGFEFILDGAVLRSFESAVVKHNIRRDD